MNLKTKSNLVTKVAKLNYAIVILLFFCSCNLGAGTHGSIKRYEYQVKMDILKQAVDKVIASNPNIRRKSTVQSDVVVDVTNGENDTLIDDNQFNDGVNYAAIIINDASGKCEYTFRYTGDPQDWQKNSTSELFIAYAYDANRNGGSVGNGDFPWYRSGLKKKLEHIFEREFVDRVDNELGVKHTSSEN